MEKSISVMVFDDAHTADGAVRLSLADLVVVPRSRPATYPIPEEHKCFLCSPTKVDLSECPEVGAPEEFGPYYSYVFKGKLEELMEELKRNGYVVTMVLPQAVPAS
ncbi:hypothetical protein C4561_05700 [candidate division WWE3 bacterium]|jgi:hypothetical protein|uniref:Uncharacterized protein n=1 Tax=candidate division WWE3 bacterium TaxID=2053526 RepID=A0A3A4ZHY8_UNCKA|nr:MAG: hypothetical protein C4561_05700 [candidate division WWE3 bacterium]